MNKNAKLLEKRMNFYADQRDKAYTSIQKSRSAVTRAFAIEWHQKYCDKFNAAYKQWKLEEAS